MDEIDCIGAFDGTMALGEAANFVGVGGLPERAFTTLAQLPVLSQLAGIGIEGVAM